MPFKCSIGGCKSNYDTEAERVSSYGFPLDDPDKLQRWIDAVPNVLPDRITKSMRVCVKHWPAGYETYRKKGHNKPVHPPSVFSVPKSYLRQTVPSTPRQVKARNVTAKSFTTLLSRGKLSYPSSELFDLSCVLFTYYKEVEKSCIIHLMDAFQRIYESCHLTYENDKRILRRFLNSFSKAFANDATDCIRVVKKKDSIKRRRLANE